MIAFAITPCTSRAASFLPPEQAFGAQVLLQDAQTVQVIIDIAPGYYLYRKRLHWTAQTTGLHVGEVHLPSGQIKHDPNFNEDLEVYHDRLVFDLPLHDVPDESALDLSYQGCAEQGLCYPPIHTVVTLQARHGRLVGVLMPSAMRSNPAGGSSINLSAHRSATPAADTLRQALGASPSLPQAASAMQAHNDSMTASSTDASTPLDRILREGSWAHVILAFYVAGVLLSLTPCVLPLLPILSSIIMGSQSSMKASTQTSTPSRSRRTRNLLLASSYSLGLALVYTAVGVAAGLAGRSLTAALQTPLALIAFALLLAVLSLSMFGVYELQLPAAWRDRLASASDRQRGGQLLGVFLMGTLSALMVGPCVSAPLAAALIYISSTHDAYLGALAMFSLAAGMSLPLLLVGASADSWLPRAGAWMARVKIFFGFVLLGVALWMVLPLLDARVFMVAVGLLLLSTAVFCFRLFDPVQGSGRNGQLVGKIVGLALALAGVAQWAGVMMGGDDVLRPLTRLASPQEEADKVVFQRVGSQAQIDAIVAQTSGVVVLDFYADWCTSCKEMERLTFSRPDIARRMKRAVLLQVDLTQDTPTNVTLLKHYGVFGPPATLFLQGGSGQELRAARTLGYLASAPFAQRLDAAGL